MSTGQDRYRRQWEALGADDPYWAVLTDPRKKGGGWDRDAFFRTGAAEIDRAMKTLSRLGARPGRAVALDYGCGVGRLSRALSTRFEQVIGVDIAEAMLAEARAMHASFPQLRFLRNSGDSLAGIDDASVDLVYSNIVLQHAPRRHQRLLIAEFCRVLRSGGALVFQVPDRPDLRNLGGVLHRVLGNRVLNLLRRLRYGGRGVMEMHAMAKDDVLRHLDDGGMVLLDAEPSKASGAAFVAYRYFAVKR